MKLYKSSVDEFIQRTKHQRIRVDALHLSPPCQFFSPAHTRESARDDENIFALFGCHDLIEKTRPRVVTLEQTFGLTHMQHKQYFDSLLGHFTYFEYGVRWKIVHLHDWGLAQDRKRLIIIAAAPGEALPTFPSSTHSESGSRETLPYNSIGNCIKQIRNGDSLHDLANVRYFQPPRRSYDSKTLAGTITTGGLDSYHPSGTREFTLREFASLQGFPRYHIFRGNKTSIKRQIGNAFASNTVTVLYRHLETWLLTQDGMQRNEPQPLILDLDNITISSTSDRLRNGRRVMTTGPFSLEFSINRVDQGTEMGLFTRAGRERKSAGEAMIDLT